MTEFAPRRLFQTCTWGCGANSGSGSYRIWHWRLFKTCTWGCGANSGSGAYSAAALISKQLKNKIQRIERIKLLTY